MKKLLILGSLAAALSSSAFAEDSNLYLRFDAGAGIFLNPLPKDYPNSDHFSERTTPFFNVGLGSYLLGQKARAELNFSYYLHTNYVPSFDYSAIESFIVANNGLDFDTKILDGLDVIDNLVGGAAANVKKHNFSHRVKAFSVMPRAYFDLWDFEQGKAFLGAGLGYANLKLDYPIKVELKGDDESKNLDGVLYAYDTSHNLAWSLHAGFDWKLPNECMKLNFEYSFTELGKPAKNLDWKLRSHNFSLGLRYHM